MEENNYCPSIINMKIKFTYESNNKLKNIKIFLNNLFKIFPNLLKLIIKTKLSWYNYYNNDFNEIKIGENLNSKINEIFLYCKVRLNEDINIYCRSYETVKTLHIESNNNILNLDKIFPLFNNKCNINLASLKYLHFEIKNEKIDSKILKNIYNNIDKMPNLKYLYFYFIIFDINITKQFYDK